jgi:hypothetical protein
MGLRRYHGPITTVEQAVFADLPILITCQECAHFRQMHSYQLKRMRPDAGALPLWKAVRGFYCKGCRRKVTVVITAPMHWS